MSVHKVREFSELMLRIQEWPQHQVMPIIKEIILRLT